ncbi:hypothetical protein [Alkalibacterium psychrotolerans]
MGKKQCKRVSRKVSEAGRKLSTSKSNRTKRQAAKTLAEHQHRYH